MDIPSDSRSHDGLHGVDTSARSYGDTGSKGRHPDSKTGDFCADEAADADIHIHAPANSHGCAHSDGNIVPNTNGDPNTHSDAFTNRHTITNAHANRDAGTDIDPGTHSDASTKRDRDAQPDFYARADPDTGPVLPVRTHLSSTAGRRRGHRRRADGKAAPGSGQHRAGRGPLPAGDGGTGTLRRSHRTTHGAGR